MDKNILKKDLFVTIYSYSLISIVLVILFSLLTNLYFFRLLLKDTEEKYKTSLMAVSETLNTTFKEIIDTAALISTYEEFNNILFYPGTLSTEDYGHFFQSQQTLSRFRTAKDSFIYSVFIILSGDNRIISNFGSSTIKEFTQITHISDRYDSLDWLLLDYKDRNFNLLPPGKVRNESTGTETIVLPLVIYQADNRLFSNPMVIDIKQNNLSAQLEQVRHTPNSILLIEDSGHNRIISSAGVKDIPIPDNLSMDSHLIKWEGKKYLTIGYKNPRAIFNNWTYHAVVPYGDLVRASLDKIVIPMIILLVSLLSSALVAYILSGRIYNPIGILVNSFKSRHPQDSFPGTQGELEYLSREISFIIEDREKLSDELSQALPFVCERFLLSVLNGESLSTEDEIREFLKNHDLSFEKSSFSVALTTINFTQNFYSNFTRTDHDSICNSILKAFQNFSRNELQGYHFLIDSDRICSIYNMERIISQEFVSIFIEEIHNQLDLDHQTLKLVSGIGRIHDKMEGMKTSYREAVNALGTAKALENGGILLYSQVEIGNRAEYSMEEENILFNLILKGDSEKSENFISALESRLIGTDDQSEEYKEFYTQIYNTGKRILSLREKSDYDLMGNDYINIIMSKENLKGLELKEYVHLFINNLIKKESNNSRQLNRESLTLYLNDHYQEDIYLDKIGEAYGVTAKYASRIIKQELGMSFQRYISHLRISRAKELLEKTDKPIADIALTIGFNSRHPFIRMFKILEGITPSEYRHRIAPQLKTTR